MRGFGPGGRGRPFAEIDGKLFKAHPRVRDQGKSFVFRGIEHLGVEADNCFLVILEKRPGTRGEILEPGAYGQHNISLFANLV